MSKTYALQTQEKFKQGLTPGARAKIEGHGNVGSQLGDRYFVAAELSDPNFHDFVGRAYGSNDGVAYRINPITGEKEMMIAGTRTMGQWGLNLLDTALYGGDKAIAKGKGMIRHPFKTVIGTAPKEHVKLLQKFDLPRKRKEAYYARLARNNGVDVVYGHSRGGAMAADLDFDGTKVGLDAAMLLADNTDVYNFNEGGSLNPTGLFDAAIGLTGEKNVTMDLSTWSPHQVWG